MGARDYMFGLLGDPAIMARVNEARDRLFEFRTFWAKRYREAIDFTQVDDYFASFEIRARKTFERMCDDCIFTVTNGTNVHNPYREGRRRREENDKTLAIGPHHDPGPDQLCLTCENAWLDELLYGWQLYCERRIDCIGWGVPKNEPLDYSKCRRLPGGKYMWYSYAIPGYTAKEAWEIHETRRSLFYFLGKIVEEKSKKDFLTRLHELQKKYNKVFVRKELLKYEINIVIAEHISEDGKRLALWEASSEERSNQVRAEIRTEFLSRTVAKYGEDVLNVISPSDIRKYCIDVEAGGDEDDLWHSALAKYDFDQTTDSCLYFIKQGTATKIGITDSLDSRFSQIRTSAAFPCEIANVVYTHCGYKMEQKLHQRLSQFNSHLEWFVLPSEIEEGLFKAKSLNDIEDFLKWFDENY